MSQPSEQAMSSGLSTTISSVIMVPVMVIIFIVFVLVFFFYLHNKGYHGANPTTRRSRDRLIFVTDQGAVPRRGLDPAIIQALPVTVFCSKDFEEGIECAVCLSELSEGEEARLLPKCNHGFHLECIDMWFHSNSTCPLCRSSVCCDPLQSSEPGTQLAEIPPVEQVTGDGNSTGSRNFPASVMFWGFNDQVSTGVVGAAAIPYQGSSSSEGSSSGKTEGMLVIEIPRQVVDVSPSPNSPLPSIRLPAEDIKSPTLVRLRSLRRLLSRGSKGAGSCSPRGGDIEQGAVGVRVAVEGGLMVPRTPRAREQFIGA